MNRSDFLKKAIRYILLTVLGLITVLLSSRIATGSDCESCPGKGICGGESDCSKYLHE